MPSVLSRRVALAAAAVSAACPLSADLTAPAFADPAGTNVVVDQV